MKNISIQLAHETNFVNKNRSKVAAWLNAKNNLVSSMLEETVTNRQFCQMANFSTSLVCMCTLAQVSNVLLVISLIWLVAAGIPLMKGGLK